MECPAHCPTECRQNELKCWGGRDGNGCEMPGNCRSIHSGQWDNNGFVECPANCDVHCDDDEFRCPGGSYPNGCNKPDICLAKQCNYFSLLSFLLFILSYTVKIQFKKLLKKEIRFKKEFLVTISQFIVIHDSKLERESLSGTKIFLK